METEDGGSGDREEMLGVSKAVECLAAVLARGEDVEGDLRKDASLVEGLSTISGKLWGGLL